MRVEFFSAAVAAPAVLSSAGADLPSSQPSPPGIVVTTGGADSLASLIEVRCDGPCTLTDSAVLRAVINLRTKIAEQLGGGIKFVLEEVRDPDAPERSTVYLIARLPADDDLADEQLDSFIRDHWVAQPASVRKVVRIGREFV